MSTSIDFAKVVPCTRMRGDSDADTAQLESMRREAEGYLSAFAWCQKIKECYFGLGIGGVIAVFLFHIQPGNDGADEWLWVISGDLPPAYLVVDQSPTPVSALETYVNEMREWVNAASKAESVDEIIPVNVPANTKNAIRLQRRLDFLVNEIVPLYK